MFLHSGLKFDRFGEELSQLDQIEKIGDSYFNVKGKRIVSVSKGIDNTDVPNMEQLNEVNNRVRKLTRAIEITDDCVKIKGHRRICNVTRAENNFDVVTNIQRIELVNQLVLFQDKINETIAIIRSDIQSLMVRR